MTLIISLANQKGGVGKSTLALNLARFYATKNVKTAIVDADAQGSIARLLGNNPTDWHGIDLITKDRFRTFQDLKNLNQYQLVVIDTPPYLSTDLPKIFEISNFILIPMKAGAFDFLSTGDIISLVGTAMQKNKRLKAGIVINMALNNKKSQFEKSFRDLLKNANIERNGISLLKTPVTNRIEFSRSALRNETIFETEDENAKKEIIGVGLEVMKELGLI